MLSQCWPCSAIDTGPEMVHHQKPRIAPHKRMVVLGRETCSVEALNCEIFFQLSARQISLLQLRCQP
jgi:hypothetical protein